MSYLEEGSRKWKALLNAKRKVLKKLDRRTKQLTNALTKLIVDIDAAENVTFSVLGDLVGLRRKSRIGDKGNKANQKINQCLTPKSGSSINTNHCSNRYAPKAREKYGSQTCSCCGTRNKSYRVHRGLWRCKNCGVIMHADVNGVNGILKNYLFGHCDMKQLFLFKPPEVYWWNKRLNRFVKVSPRAVA